MLIEFLFRLEERNRGNVFNFSDRVLERRCRFVVSLERESKC